MYDFTSQQKKRWLQRYKDLDQEIKQRLDTIDQLRSLAERTTTTLTGMPSGGGYKSRDDIYIKLVDLSKEVNEKIDEYVDMQSEIEHVINHVKDGTLRSLLYKRYINCKTFEQIAVDMTYCIRQVYSLHGQALQAVEIKPKDCIVLQGDGLL